MDLMHHENRSEEQELVLNDQMLLLYDDGPYTAYTEDLEFMWRWSIYRDCRLVQEGCSVSLDASRRAVGHVMAFFNMQDLKVGLGGLG
jgi:methane monooxygenase component D